MSAIDSNPFAEPANENPFNVSALLKVYLGLTASDGVKQQLTQKLVGCVSREGLIAAVSPVICW